MLIHPNLMSIDEFKFFDAYYGFKYGKNKTSKKKYKEFPMCPLSTYLRSTCLHPTQP
jgi:hypothetical protein